FRCRFARAPAPAPGDQLPASQDRDGRLRKTEDVVHRPAFGDVNEGAQRGQAEPAQTKTRNRIQRTLAKIPPKAEQGGKEKKSFQGQHFAPLTHQFAARILKKALGWISPHLVPNHVLPKTAMGLNL